MAPIEEMALLDFDRSNKGASKQRRDQINAEITTMRDLLPLPESSRQKLSQLQIMSLTCVYIRKCNILQKLFRPISEDSKLLDCSDVFPALTGFLLVTTREGKLLYISENVTDYLGHSMVDMKTQGDSLYDIVDRRDHSAMQTQLMKSVSVESTEPKDVSFFCRMNMSRTLKRQSGFGDVKVMHVRGHFIPESSCPGDSNQHVFMAICSPLITPDLKENLVENNTMVFRTIHQLDMTVREASKSAEYHLGCSTEELYKKSWYSMLHPEYIYAAKEKHVQLIQSNHELGCMMTVRMLRSDGTDFWVNVVMHVRQASSQNDEPLIVCINQVITAQEAYQIKVQSHMFSVYPNRGHDLWGNHLPGESLSVGVTSGAWVQQNGSNSVPIPGYQTTSSGFVTHNGHQPIYHVQCRQGMSTQRLSDAAVHSSCFNPTTMVQSDKLKAMLKRKIQGPQPESCRPNKIAKISWGVDGMNGRQGYEDRNHSNNLIENYSQTLESSGMKSQGPVVNAMHPSVYKVGCLTTSKSHDVMKYAGVAASSLSKLGGFVSEQVVPDVNVPESYLTPDPSPVSSPQPSQVVVKTEVMDPEEVLTQTKSSVSILQALEKLASLPNEVKVEKSAAVAPALVPVQMEAAVATKRRELPIFDAFDIETFFDALDTPGIETKVSVKVESVESDVKPDVIQDNTCPYRVPHFLELKNERPTSPSFSVQNQPGFSGFSQHHHQVQPFVPSDTLGTVCHKPQDIHQNEYTGKAKEVPNKKDPVVSSVTVPVLSPKSVSSHDGFDDLLSCFSDDGLDLSPLQMDPRSLILETSIREDLFDDHYEKCYGSFPKGPRCAIPQQANTKASSEALSPQSNSPGSLSEEDDLIEDTLNFTLTMAVDDVMDAKKEVCSSSFKDREVLGISDEYNQLDYFLKCSAF